MKYFMLLLIVPFSGCAAVREIQDNAESIVGGLVGSFIDVDAGNKIAEAVTSPSVISLTEAALAAVAVVTGGVAGYVGVKKGKKVKK